ncbi:unnamed protein product [Amaranthus hypochondriacus]
MVQRKVANNKLGIHVYDSTLKIEKRQGNTKTSLQNYDYKTKGADLKVKRMKKSRSIKRSDVEISLCSLPESHEAPRQPEEPPPLVTPSPKKPSSPCKTPCSYPNYMKSTSSSEARKENNPKVSRVSSILKTSTKTSSLEKVRTLTKSPSFKHTRISTCSSTLKDSKFPAYLELKPGATEAEGNSLFRVCPYNYCSLNGHHHKSALPLKRFLSSRRRVLKGNKVTRPEVLSPRKGKHSECVIRKAADQDDNFFVEIYVPDKEVATQVSESLSDGPCSDIDFQYDDQCEDSSFSDLHIIHKEGYSLTSIPNQSSFKKDLEEESLPGVVLDEFRENLDIEWEEGQIHIINDDGKILNECDDTNDQDTPGFEIRKSFSGYLEEFDHYPSFSHDEIVEFACFSDADSSDDNDSTQIGEKEMEQPDMAEENKEIDSLPDNEVAEDNFILANEATIDAPMLEYESTDEHDGISSHLITEITEVQYGDLDSYQESFVSDSDVATEDNVTGEILREENAAEFVMEEMEANEETSKVPEIAKNLETSGLKGGSCNANDDNQGGTDQSEGVTCVGKSTQKSGGSDSDEIKFCSIQDNVEAEPSEMENYNATEAAKASPAAINKKQNASKNTSNSRESDSNQDLVSNRIKRGMRWKNAYEDVEYEREFNPRGPNFLDIEPDPEAEKVDLKHQEMDARRNAEEWMLDYALQKTLNQLAPARKKKVALLVEAFDAVLPEHKHEFRRNSANFPYVKSIQACS